MSATRPTADDENRPARKTPNLGLPVPGDAAPADAPTDIGALADRIDELMAAAYFQPGDLKGSAAATPPPGWLPCDGRVLQRASFPALFAAIGTTYGTVDEQSFRIPNLERRMLAGAGNGWDPGNYGGDEQVTLAVGHMPHHNHGGAVWDPSHAHSINDPGHAHHIPIEGVNTGWPPGSGTWLMGGGSSLTGNQGTAIGIWGQYTGVQVFGEGGGAPHQNMPPFVTVHFFIKT